MQKKKISLLELHAFETYFHFRKHRLRSYKKKMHHHPSPSYYIFYDLYNYKK